jgi:hypothetical protein
MDAKELLAELAGRVRDYDFPVLDNAHWKLISGRLRGFRRAGDIALVFEVLIFQSQAQSFLVNVYAYGTLIDRTQADVGAFSPIDEAPDSPLWDEEGEWIPGLPMRKVSVNGLLVSVIHDARLSAESTVSPEAIFLSQGDDVDEGAFGRGIVRELGLHRVMPDRAVLGVLPQLGGATEVVRLSNWDHPDIIGGQLPSDSVAITQVAMLLAGETERITYDHMRDNVDWRSWAF